MAFFGFGVRTSEVGSRGNGVWTKVHSSLAEHLGNALSARLEGENIHYTIFNMFGQYIADLIFDAQFRSWYKYCGTEGPSYLGIRL